MNPLLLLKLRVGAHVHAYDLLEDFEAEKDNWNEIIDQLVHKIVLKMNHP